MPLHFLVDAVPELVGEDLTITGPEAHHAAVVRRVRVGEEVTVGDGAGAWLHGEVTAVEPKAVTVRVHERTTVPQARPRLVLVQALAKGDRDELAVQAATELGIDEIVPWQAARSVSRWAHASRGPAQGEARGGGGHGEDAAKAAKGRARWASIVREAAKQAHRAWVPTVAELATSADLSARVAASRVLVLDPAGGTRLTRLALDADDPRDIVLVVGPEGGIAPDELDRLTDAGGTVVSLGDTVLRTSTAGPAAIAVVSAALGRW